MRHKFLPYGIPDAMPDRAPAQPEIPWIPFQQCRIDEVAEEIRVDIVGKCRPEAFGIPDSALAITWEGIPGLTIPA